MVLTNHWQKEEKEKTLELCSQEFGKGNTCLLFGLLIHSSLDLNFISCKMGMNIIALLRCSIYVREFFWGPKGLDLWKHFDSSKMTCKYQGLIPGLFILYKLLKPRIENDS